jgi:hypothetical protein
MTDEVKTAEAPEPSYRYLNGQVPEVIISEFQIVSCRENKAVRSFSDGQLVCGTGNVLTVRVGQNGTGWDRVGQSGTGCRG